MHPVAQTLNTIRNELNGAYYERRDAVDAMTLAVLSREHAFVLGPPGTGKSALARDFLGRFTGAMYFEQLLSKTRPDQAVLGPYNLPLLRDEGRFQRQIDGFLLTCTFAFLDEVGKMSPTMGHDMLAALNERIRHEVSDGNSAHPIPLHTAITASNELIATDGEDAQALWDRLLIRTTVDHIVDDGSFAALMMRSNSSATTRKHTTMTYGVLQEGLLDVEDVTITDETIGAVIRLRQALRSEAHMQVSDRRWRASMKLLKAQAFLAGRTETAPDDVEVLRFTLWDLPEQISVVKRLCAKIASPLNEELALVEDQLLEIRKQVSERAGKALKDRAGYGSEALAKLTTANNELRKLKTKYASSDHTRLQATLDEVQSTRRFVFKEALDLDPDQMPENR